MGEAITPWQQLIDSGAVLPDDIPESWDWDAFIPSRVWHSISLGDNNWDRIGGSPPFVMLEHRGAGPSSRGAAVGFDGIATGLCYYCNWTASGIPYWSSFWFQNIADAMRFHRLHSGVASWVDGFKVAKFRALTDLELERKSK